MKKILSLLSLLMLCVVGVNAASIDDVKVCEKSYVLCFDDWNENGSAKPGKGQLFGDGYFLDVTGGSVATNKGKVNLSVLNEADNNHVTQYIVDTYGADYPDDHLNSWRLKNNQDVIAMKVIAGSKLIFFLQGNNKNGTAARIPKIATDAKLENALNAAPDETFPTTDEGFRYEWTASDDLTIYIGSYNGDMFLSYLIVEVPGQEVTNKNIILNATDWGASDARYAVYAFNSNEDNTWIDFLPTAQNGYYATQVGDNYANIILVRMNGTTTENNWDNKWNQTADIDFTKIADGTIFTVKFEGENSVYTTSNPLVEAKDKLTKAIALAEVLDDASLANAIADAKAAVAGDDIDAITNATTALMGAAATPAQTLLANVKDFADKYGYTDLSNAVTALQAALVSQDIDAISEKFDALKAVAIQCAPDAVAKIEDYAKALDNEALNTAVAEAKAAAAQANPNFKTIIEKIQACEEPFKTAAADYVDAIKNIEDANVQAKLAAVVDALNNNANIVTIGEAVRQLVEAYEAYLLEQNPVYTVAGTADLTGYVWDTTQNEMTLNAETGLYEWTSKVVVVTANQIPEFQVVRNYKEWYPGGGESNNWKITPEYVGGEGPYTITITFNAETKVIGVIPVKREAPEFAENNVYYWESPDGYVDQNGGEATGEDDINIVNDKYNVIRLRGKKDFSSQTVVITLDQPLKAGDQIAITAFRNKNEAGKVSGALLKFNDNSNTTLTIGSGLAFNNINTAEAVADEFGEPNTITEEVPEAAAGSTTITMTRAETGTNLFITKIEITRPPVEITSVTLMGSSNGWQEPIATFTVKDASTGYWTADDVVFAANDEFKVVVNYSDKSSMWLAPESNGNFLVYADQLNKDLGLKENTPNMYVANAAKLSFNMNPAFTTLVINGEFLTLTLNEEEDNTNILDEWNGKTADVTLTRTLQTGSWNTFSVPFDLDTPNGWTVKELESSSVAGTTVTLNFKDAASIEAGKPYLVKLNANDEAVIDPTFTGVTVSNAAEPTVTDLVNFIPTFGATDFTGNDKDAILFLAAGNKLQNPTDLSAGIKGFRAYFLLKNVNSAREFVLDFGDGETTGITDVRGKMEDVRGGYYDLQGRRINSAAQKGVYIVNGKKTVIK